MAVKNYTSHSYRPQVSAPKGGGNEIEITCDMISGCVSLPDSLVIELQDYSGGSVGRGSLAGTPVRLVFIIILNNLISLLTCTLIFTLVMFYFLLPWRQRDLVRE